MELTWGPDFEAFSRAAREMCSRHEVELSPEAESRQHPGLWAKLVEMGWPSASDPRPEQAEAAPLASMAGLFVELGRGLAVTPLVEAVMARELLLLSGLSSDDQTCADIEAGRSLVIPVLTGSPLDAMPQQPRRAAGALQGTALLVPFADRADAFLVHVGGEGQDQLVLLPRTAAGLTVEHLPNIAAHPLFAVCFDGVDPAQGTVVAAGPAAASNVALAQERAAVLRAAELYGAGCSLLDKTVRYAKERRQFGQAIGQFQAVQYLCTDIAVNVHLLSALVRHAARRLDAHERAEAPVAMMRAHAARTAQLMVHCAHEVHAGIGFMLESHLHLHTRMAKYWQFAMGDADRLAHAVVAPLVAASEGH